MVYTGINFPKNKTGINNFVSLRNSSNTKTSLTIYTIIITNKKAIIIKAKVSTKPKPNNV